ncbi:DUF58 domain-containing protein [Phycisphaerales bacterium AB-hyl4]|uniref:DUF58 domain-containing protein n=1 Tax=Natronomicrosphaera hydrolytica TaxID=3242702 RepID=A0ABV4UB64_9BACT
MTVPSRVVLWLLVVLAGVLLASAVLPGLLWVGLAGNAAVLLACVMEGAWLGRQDVRVSRWWDRRVQIDRPTSMHVSIENRSRRRMVVALRQVWPTDVEAVGGRAQVTLAPGERAEVELTFTARRRGPIAFQPVEVEAAWPLGLAKRRWTAGGTEQVTVFPDLQSLWTYERLRRSRALRHFGIHAQRMVGAGRELDQLRDYLPDDNYRDINWKATARRMTPITTVYQTERSRDVLLCVDCGRMMGEPVGGGTVLDRAVDAAVLLAHAATRQGDRIGLMRFGSRVDLSLKPTSGRVGVQKVIEGLVWASPQPVFASYPALVSEVRRRQNHRTLIFLFTSLNDPQLSGELARFVPLLSRRHLVVVVSLRDPLLDQTAEGGADDREQVYDVLAARQLADERNAHCRALSKAGVHVLEADAQGLQLKIINEYLSIKSRQLL